MMNLTQRTVGELVAEDYRRATVFKKYGIDFCCGGGRTLQAVCDRKGVSLDELTRALRDAVRKTDREAMQPDLWAPDFLADYIVQVHHAYVRESLPILQEYLQKVGRVHGAAQPEVIDIARLFDELAAELLRHMVKEEDMLFPYIRTLTAASTNGRNPGLAPFGTVQNPIRMMEHEHDRAGAILRAIRTMSGDYTPPDYACNTYRVAYAKLEEFEGDLHRHVHLENNILFPKAAALEEALITRAAT